MILLRREEESCYSGVHFAKVHYLHLMLCASVPDNVKSFYLSS